jgi:hypothetical protein
MFPARAADPLKFFGVTRIPATSDFPLFHGVEERVRERRCFFALIFTLQNLES